MTHQLQLEKEKYRQWVKAGLGLGYLKEGLVPFCNDIADQQHKDILESIRSTKSLPSTVTCGSCRIETLKPDHKPVGNAGKFFCPFGQVKCSCCFTKCKIACPNNICGAIYDYIVQHHASSPPAPNWKISDAKQWSVDPWSICKCFINAPGYEQKQSAGETDCTGLLHLLINNQYFHSHIACNVTGTNNLFSKVRQYRNDIFHSSSMELEESEANAYIDDMIAVLQDRKELLQQTDAQKAVKKLQDLKNRDFIITTEGFEEILRQIKAEMAKVLKSTENAATEKEYEDLKNKLSERKVETEKLENKLADLEKQMFQDKKGQQVAEKELADLKRKCTVLVTIMKEQEQEIKRLKVEESPQQKQFEYEKDKSEWRQKLIEQYQKTLLQVLKTPIQPKSEKCSFDKIYIRPKITRVIKGGKGKTKEVEVKTMSEIFTKDGVPQKAVYVVGEAGSGKTSFCKYLVSCWCLAHIEEQADNKRKDGSGKSESDSEKHGGDDETHGAVIENEAGSGKTSFCKYLLSCWCLAHIEEQADNERKNGRGKSESDSENHGGENEEHKKSRSDIVNEDIKGKHSGDRENEDGRKTHQIIYSRKKSNGSGSDDIRNNSDELIHFEYNSDDSDGDLINCESDNDDSEYNSKTYELKFNGVKDMKKFDFLFYIPLRQYQKNDTIDKMLHKRYQMKILSKLLNEESSKVMILLDGLDEWSSENVPEHSIFKEYTIVTTSRPWKFHTLRSSDVEIEQLLKLKGLDFKCEREMVYRTVSQLNVNRQANREARHFIEKIEEKSLKCLKQVPIMLQQLICLWFDGKLDKTSRCAIYSGILELFITWNDMKTPGTGTRLIKSTQKVNLPKYLANKDIFKFYSHLIYEVSQLAYETLFNCPKNKSLTFDISMFDEVNISDEVRENCLKLGIITEDECPSLFVSEPPSSLFSFIHKSIQEFLASVNFGINFNLKIGSSDSTGNFELESKCVQFVHEFFQKCLTVNDILEQANVVNMICGLEPKLARHVSKYIHDIVSEDSRVKEYRRTISSDIYMDLSCITDIQKLILESIDELNATSIEGGNPIFYIGDLVIENRENCDMVCSRIDQHQIAPDSVLSICVDDIDAKYVNFSEYLPMFHHLEKIKITYESSLRRLRTQSDSIQCYEQRIDEINTCFAETIKVNTLTLKSLSLSFGSDLNYTTLKECYPVCQAVVNYLPSMINLVAISMSDITMSHDDTSTFCLFLIRTSHLEQIYLNEVKCDCKFMHDIDLSRHQKLQYLNMNVNVIDAGTANLEILYILKVINHAEIFDIIRKSEKLKQLVLYADYLNELYITNITNRLISVLPLLHNLSKLVLHNCKFTDNIIQLPSEMKSLKNIELARVIMSLTTWQEFVDSLPEIPQSVDVSVRYFYITGDGENLKRNMLTFQNGKGGKGNDAKQYVKDRNQLFRIKRDNVVLFEFSTKK